MYLPMIIKLNETSLKTFIDFRLSDQKLWKQQNYFVAENPNDAEEFLSKYINSETAELYGYTDKNNNLKMCLGYKKWDFMPCYSFEGHFSQSNNSISETKKIFSSLVLKILEKMEQEKRYTFYFATRSLLVPTTKVSNGNAYFGKWFEYLSKYTFTTEEILKAGDRSQFSVHRNILGFKVHDCDITIRKGTLKEDFRIL